MRIPDLCAVIVAMVMAAGALAQPVTRPAQAGEAQTGQAQAGQAQAEVGQAELNKRFAELLTDATLVGRFTVGDEPAAKEDRYGISSATKLLGDMWLVTAKMKTGDQEVSVPVPVMVRFAGDTPMIQVTDLTLPGMGTFSARVLFYDNQYAGTWRHGEKSGLMYGKVEKKVRD